MNGIIGFCVGFLFGIIFCIIIIAFFTFKED